MNHLGRMRVGLSLLAFVAAAACGSKGKSGTDAGVDAGVACSGACPAGQYQSAPCTATADRICSACTSIKNCNAETCTSDSNQTCTACGTGYYLSNGICAACSGGCPAGQYQTAACGATADRACAACTAIANCTAETCTTTSDQSCSACGTGYFASKGSCAACSSGACPSGQYESTACGPTADRVCSSCPVIPNCTAETCTNGSDQTCTACGTGYYLASGACVACSGACPAGQYQTAACSAANDRACSACAAITACATESCTTGSDETCSACQTGYYLSGGACVACSGACPAGQFQSAACGATADRACSACTAIGNCTAETCTTASDQTCGTCSGGYYVSGGACSACTAVIHCTAETCTTGSDQTCTACSSPYSACSGACVDEQTDVANCGGCGLACPAGLGTATCASGLCAPAQIASSANNLGAFHSLTVDPSGGTVYWTDEVNHILHAYVVATATDSVLASFGANIRPLHMATDGTYVYISDENGGALEKILIAAPNTLTTVSGGNGGEGQGVAVDGQNLYWCSVPGGNGTPTVSQRPIAGSNTPVTTLFTGAANSNFPYDLALDSPTAATTVFWLDGAANTVNAAPVGVANGNVVLVTGLPSSGASGAIASDGTRIYWATSSPGSGSDWILNIYSAAIPAPLAAIPANAITKLYSTTTGTGSVFSMIVGGGNLYWSERSVSNSSVSRMPVTGGTPTVLGTGLGTVNAVRLGTGPTSGFLFWTEGSNGNADGLYEALK